MNQTSPYSEGIKHDRGKLRWRILPWDALAAVVEVMQWAIDVKGYPEGNWRKVSPERYLDATMRHLLAHMRGELWDEESGRLHLAHAACCILFLLSASLVSTAADGKPSSGSSDSQTGDSSSADRTAVQVLHDAARP